MTNSNNIRLGKNQKEMLVLINGAIYGIPVYFDKNNKGSWSRRAKKEILALLNKGLITAEKEMMYGGYAYIFKITKVGKSIIAS